MPAPLHTPCRRVGRQLVPSPGPPACSLLPARAVLEPRASPAPSSTCPLREHVPTPTQGMIAILAA